MIEKSLGLGNCCIEYPSGLEQRQAGRGKDGDEALALQLQNEDTRSRRCKAVSIFLWLSFFTQPKELNPALYLTAWPLYFRTLFRPSTILTHSALNLLGNNQIN